MKHNKKTYQINKDSLTESLKEAYLNTLDFSWTGWRIPIYLDEDSFETSTGSFLSNNSWQPDTHELPLNVLTWNMSDLGYDDNYTDDDVDNEIDEKINWYINSIEDYYDEEYEYKVN
jgi:hypothetical protein